MADVQIDFTPTPIPFQFTGPIDPAGSAPVGRMIAEEQNSAIAAKIATNTQTVTVTVFLPVNKAYALEGVYCSILTPAAIVGDSDSIENYENQAEGILFGNGRSSTVHRIQMAMTSDGAHNSLDNVGSRKEWTIKNPFKSILFNDEGLRPAADFVFEDTDATNATAAATMWFYSSWLVYEIPQAYHAAVSAPFPVRIV